MGFDVIYRGRTLICRPKSRSCCRGQHPNLCVSSQSNSDAVLAAGGGSVPADTYDMYPCRLLGVLITTEMSGFQISLSCSIPYFGNTPTSHHDHLLTIPSSAGGATTTHLELPCLSLLRLSGSVVAYQRFYCGFSFSFSSQNKKGEDV